MEIIFLLKEQLLYQLYTNLVYISNFALSEILVWYISKLYLTHSLTHQYFSASYIWYFYKHFDQLLTTTFGARHCRIRLPIFWGGKKRQKLWNSNPCSHTRRERKSMDSMNEEWNERHMNMKRRLSKTGLFMSNIWCIQAVKSEAGISRIDFTPLTHPLPLPICSHKTGPECATGNQAKTIREKCILILATQLPLGSLNTLPSKCFHTPSYPSALDRLSLNCKLIPQLISVWHCYSNQTKLVKCPVGANWVLIQVPSLMWLEVMSYSLQILWIGTSFRTRIKNNLFFFFSLSSPSAH